MLGLTHLTIGAMATSLVLQTANPTLIAIGAIASLLPDVDTSRSPAGQVLPWLSHWLEARMPHRSCTHSVLASLVVAIATYPPAIWLKLPIDSIHAVNIGYFIGWYADSFTKTGVEMFWPDRSRWVIPRNRKYRLSTGSPAEWTLLSILILLALLIFHINLNGGMSDQFNRLLGTSNGVLEVYNKVGGSRLVTVHVEGIMEGDRTPVTGDYLLIRPHGHNFIVQSKKTGEIYQVGKDEADCQILFDRITADPEGPAITTIESLQLSLDSISQALERFNQHNAMVFISGELSINDVNAVLGLVSKPNEFRTFHTEGSKVIFETAPLQQVIWLLGNELGTGYLSVKSIYVQSDTASMQKHPQN